MVVSLIGIYKALRNRGDAHLAIEKSFNYPKKERVTTQVSEILSPRYLKSTRASAPASWRAHTHFEFPSKAPGKAPSKAPGKAPPRRSLRISHPYPLSTDDGLAGDSSPAMHQPSASKVVLSRSRQKSDPSPTSKPSPTSPRKSFSSSTPVGRASRVSTAQLQYQQHIAKGSGSKLPARPVSRPVMPPAAFWKYAIDKQSIGMSPGLLQRWQLESDRRSWPSSIGRSSPIPTPPTRTVTLDGRVKRRSDRAKKKTSSESFERRSFHRRTEESRTECIDGITWEIAGGFPATQHRENGRHSRKLIKKRESSS